MITISSNSELEKWLEENYYFEDGNFIEVTKDPLTIIIGYDIASNNYKAYSERKIKTFKLIPNRPKEWIFDEKTVIPSVDYFIEGIRNVESKEGIVLEFLTYATCKLTAESITISDNGIINTFNKPWVNDEEIFVSSSLRQIPLPIFWKEQLEKMGYEILFRYYCGEARNPEQLPYPDYSGCFIQLADKINTTEKGIFFKSISQSEVGIHIALEQKDPDLESVWRNLMMIIATMPDVIIQSGNCEFNGIEWKEYVRNKTLPSYK